MQDALLDEEGATPADGFSGDANAVSLRLPQAKAETKQRMQTAEEAHEVSQIFSATPLHTHAAICLLGHRVPHLPVFPVLGFLEQCMTWSTALCTLCEGFQRRIATRMLLTGGPCAATGCYLWEVLY